MVIFPPDPLAVAVATAIVAAVTTVCIAAATAAAIVAATTSIVATAVVVTALLAVAASATWVLLVLDDARQGLAIADSLAEHLELPLHCHDVGHVGSEQFLGGNIGHAEVGHCIREGVR